MTVDNFFIYKLSMNLLLKLLSIICLTFFNLVFCLFLPQNVRAKEVSIAVVGDVNLGGRVNTIIKQNSYLYPVSKLKPILTHADITFGNLECALSNRGQPVGNKEFTFCGSPQNIQTLLSGGFDLVSVANNHSKDFGVDAFLDTLKILAENGVKPVGGGKNLDEALNPVIIKKSGLKIAFLAFSDILPYNWPATKTKPGVASFRDLTEVKKTIARAKKQADQVVVSIHWGIEMSAQPLSQQEKIARQLIDSGATLIIGHHPHIIQKIKPYKTGLIAFSLGNFIFTPGSPKGSKSILLKITLDRYGVKSFQVWPIKITNARPEIAQGEVAGGIKDFIKRESKIEPTKLKENAVSLLYKTYRSQKENLFKKLTRTYFLR